VGKAAVEHIRAGGDLCLVCHREEYISQVYDELAKEAGRDGDFARRVAQSVKRVLAFKKKSAKMLRAGKLPSGASVERLSRSLWEFGEQVRLEALDREETDRDRKARRLPA
jgi:hypothetical protein